MWNISIGQVIETSETDWDSKTFIIWRAGAGRDKVHKESSRNWDENHNFFLEFCILSEIIPILPPCKLTTVLCGLESRRLNVLNYIL